MASNEIVKKRLKTVDFLPINSYISETTEDSHVVTFRLIGNGIYRLSIGANIDDLE